MVLVCADEWAGWRAYTSTTELFRYLLIHIDQLLKHLGVFQPDFELSAVCWLNPDWLGCFVHNNTLVYFSCHSGQFVYQHQLEHDKCMVRGSYPGNSLVLEQGSTLLVMVSHEQFRTLSRALKRRSC